jgi:hypothetical protein
MAGGIQIMTAAIPRIAKCDEAPPATTLAQLIAVLSELTQDENEIVGTLLHMVEQRSVRLIA